jgi:hypothetical protein
MGDGLTKPRHEWYVEFSSPPESLARAASLLDTAMQARNTYYNDLITGSILAPLTIFPVKPGGFRDYQRSVGKLGGQNKVARLANNRTIADALQPYLSHTLT